MWEWITRCASLLMCTCSAYTVHPGQCVIYLYVASMRAARQQAAFMSWCGLCCSWLHHGYSLLHLPGCSGWGGSSCWASTVHYSWQDHAWLLSKLHSRLDTAWPDFGPDSLKLLGKPASACVNLPWSDFSGRWILYDLWCVHLCKSIQNGFQMNSLQQ